MNKVARIITSKYFIWMLLLVVTAFGMLLPETLFARPGGGHSYSGGGGGGGGGYSGGGGGGGSGDGALFEALFRLFLLLPFEMQVVVVIIVVVGVIWYHLNNQGGNASTQSYVRSSGGDGYYNAPFNAQSINGNVQKQRQLELLMQKDPAFSEILFLDFAHSFYHKFYTSINTAGMRQLTPFISDNMKAYMRSDMSRTSPRQEVVVGNLQIYSIDITNRYTRIVVDFDSNYNTIQNGKPYRHILSERWVLVRKAEVESAGPQVMQNLACPNCGAPNDFNDSGVCGHCDTLVEAGNMNWMLEKVVVLYHQHYRTETLGTYAPEVGTNSPTVLDPQLNQKGRVFIDKHQLQNPEQYWSDFKEKVVRQTFMAMYAAWSERDNWKKVRHLLSDRLFESNEFWINLYKEKNYYNRLEKVKVHEIVPVRIAMDKYYEAITVRVFASAIDYTEHQSGRLIGGNKKQLRKFTEYWTFIRKSGVEKPESQFSTQHCPNCGAPADKMSDAAVCGYCGAKTNTGEFTWLLANIAQDESYKG